MLYYMEHYMLRMSHVSSHLIFTFTLEVETIIYPHFTEEKTEA